MTIVSKWEMELNDKKVRSLIPRIVLRVRRLAVAAPGLRIWGGGAFEGQTHILGGQDRIFKKVLLLICPCRCHRTFAPPPPPQEIRPPLKRGTIFLGI